MVPVNLSQISGLHCCFQSDSCLSKRKLILIGSWGFEQRNSLYPVYLNTQKHLLDQHTAR
jgi:hypothetical protein